MFGVPRDGNYEAVRLFTPEEANEALDAVRPLAVRLVAKRRELLRNEEALRGLRAKVAGNGGGIDPQAAASLQAAVEKATASMTEAIEEITALGAQVKDLDQGLVDFPARRPADGAVVLLCWRLGEDEILYWHGPEEGFAGRKPLPF